MARPETLGFQKPIDTGKRKTVGLAVITYVGDGAMCSCLKAFKPCRAKVLEDRIDAHLNEKHGGRGIRL